MSPAVYALAAAIVAALGAYVAAARKMSGTIGTSEASDLWAATKDVRDFTAEQLRIANERIGTLEGVITALHARIVLVEKENADCWERLTAIQKKTRPEVP